MKFEQVLEALRSGERLVNSTMSANRQFIVKQIPQTISCEIVPKMTSLPKSAKDVCKYGGISYRDQVLICTWDSELERYKATSYIPTWEDIFDESWTIA